MDSKKPVTYDPEASQIQALSPFGIGNLQLEDLASPPVVHLLLEQQRYTVAALRTTKKELSETRREIGNLRVEVAELRVKAKISWVEIAVGIMAGFAGNMLTTDWTNLVGWFLLITSLFMLFGLKGSPTRPKWLGIKKEKDDA